MSRTNVSLGMVLAEVVWPWPLAAKTGLNPSPLHVGCWVVIHVLAPGEAPLRAVLSAMLYECSSWVPHVSLLQLTQRLI